MYVWQAWVGGRRLQFISYATDPALNTARRQDSRPRGCSPIQPSRLHKLYIAVPGVLLRGSVWLPALRTQAKNGVRQAFSGGHPRTGIGNCSSGN